MLAPFVTVKQTGAGGRTHGCWAEASLDDAARAKIIKRQFSIRFMVVLKLDLASNLMPKSEWAVKQFGRKNQENSRMAPLIVFLSHFKLSFASMLENLLQVLGVLCLDS